MPGTCSTMDVICLLLVSLLHCITFTLYQFCKYCCRCWISTYLYIPYCCRNSVWILIFYGVWSVWNGWCNLCIFCLCLFQNIGLPPMHTWCAFCFKFPFCVPCCLSSNRVLVRCSHKDLYHWAALEAERSSEVSLFGDIKYYIHMPNDPTGDILGQWNA